MKLNTKRTIYVGFAFFLILAFWQAYDSIIPLILTNKFGMSQFWSGAIMALDNILALFLLPLFGTLSDKHKGKSGRRTPFIRVGTIAAIVLLIALSFADMTQLKNIEKVSVVDDPAALGIIYDSQADKKIVKPDKDKATLTEEYFILSEEISREDFVNIKSEILNEDGKKVTNLDYVDYVVPARQAYIWQITAGNPQALILFVGVLFLLLIAMAVFRSPAVALMPDVTVKPLRSKANAVINLMGYTGGILVLVLGKVFATDAPKNAMMSYMGYFGAVAALMLVALIVFLAKVKEPAWCEEMQEEAAKMNTADTVAETSAQKRKLTKGEKISLILLLASVILWYFGYNAVSSKYHQIRLDPLRHFHSFLPIAGFGAKGETFYLADQLADHQTHSLIVISNQYLQINHTILISSNGLPRDGSESRSSQSREPYHWRKSAVPRPDGERIQNCFLRSDCSFHAPEKDRIHPVLHRNEKRCCLPRDRGSVLRWSATDDAILPVIHPSGAFHRNGPAVRPCVSPIQRHSGRTGRVPGR